MQTLGSQANGSGYLRMFAGGSMPARACPIGTGACWQPGQQDGEMAPWAVGCLDLAAGPEEAGERWVT